MKSIEWAVTRALATRNVQASIIAKWLWPYKTLAQWDDALAGMSIKGTALSQALMAWRAQTQSLDGMVVQIEGIARDVLRMGKVRFRDNPEKKALFDSVRLIMDSRADVQKTGRAAYEVWAKTDAAWVPVPDLTLAVLGSLLANTEGVEAIWSQKRTAWRAAGIAVMTAAEALDRDNIGWYSDACVRFPADTEEGQLIRSQIPTLNTPAPAIGQAVISNMIVAGREIHFDAGAPHATKLTYLHQAPGSEGFVEVLVNVPQKSLTLHDQPPGEHRFKVFGSSSRGHGPMSAEAVVVVVATVSA